MQARGLAVVLSSLLGGCIDSGFLRGAECGDDQDCGRSLECRHGVCGGCPQGIPLVDGRCSCRGDRVLDCRALAESPYCMPICQSASDLCRVLEVGIDGTSEEIPSCPGTAGERCFALSFEATNGCSGDEASIQLQPDGTVMQLVVNCPPPDSEDSRFDCEP